MPTAHNGGGHQVADAGADLIGVSRSGPVIAMTPPNAWATTS